jgi:acetyl/propionyl-CoA carboxylase alpha subunit
MSRPADTRAEHVHLIAATLVGAHRRRQTTTILPTAPPGWRNVRSGPAWAEYTIGDAGHRVSYQLGGRVVPMIVDDTEHDVVVHTVGAETIDLSVDGIRTRVRVTRAGDTEFVDSALGSTPLEENPRFTDPGASDPTGSLLAPMPGVVVRTAVAEGAMVQSGDVIVVLEAMKMEHTVVSPHDGQVASLNVAAGQSVDGGEVLAVIAEDEQVPA